MKARIEFEEFQEIGDQFVKRIPTKIVPDILQYHELGYEQLKQYNYLKDMFPLYTELQLLLIVDQ